MKIHVIKPGQPTIAGYVPVTIDANSIALDVAADNQCTSIFAPDITDFFQLGVMHQLLSQLVKKLRLGGELVVGGTDIRLFVKSIANGRLGLNDGSQVIAGVQSMVSCDKIGNMLESMGLQVLSTHMDGIHYEIKCRREK
jgi:hypothetical protein